MLEEYTAYIADNLAEMTTANESTRAETEALLVSLNNQDGDKLGTLLIFYCSQEFDERYNQLKSANSDIWLHEKERHYAIYLKARETDGAIGWGALLLLCRFKEMMCKRMERQLFTEEKFVVPVSAFVYAMQ
ncbi:MAG: hypothetical protein CMM74_02900 [Rhodospirillaceae bacterium]|nr:hypothetical protein [Rhodospirillaceae bacterium]|tara:strand:+ start:135 stop:530 length:396 start_codon:yes stop_codon:yes gene_type:complete